MISLRPRKVAFFKEDFVFDVACDSGNQSAATYALTKTTQGAVELWSWGDNSGGKLGRPVDGGKTGIPGKVSLPDGISISKIFCGAQFVVAQTKENKLYTWGSGKYFRLGHGTEDDQPTPRLLEALKERSKKPQALEKSRIYRGKFLLLRFHFPHLKKDRLQA